VNPAQKILDHGLDIDFGILGAKNWAIPSRFWELFGEVYF